MKNLKFKGILSNVLAFIMPVLCGFLGAWGGADGTSKSWRRVMIPLSLTALAFFKTESIFVITICSMMGALSMGYGIPGKGDEGSFLGRFFYNLFHQNHFLADVFTRGTIGLLIGVSMLSVPIIRQNWKIYALCVCGIVLTNSLLSWRNLGEYTLFGKVLIWSETLTWGLIGMFATIAICVGGR